MEQSKFDSLNIIEHTAVIADKSGPMNRICDLEAQVCKFDRVFDDQNRRIRQLEHELTEKNEHLETERAARSSLEAERNELVQKVENVSDVARLKGTIQELEDCLARVKRDSKKELQELEEKLTSASIETETLLQRTISDITSQNESLEAQVQSYETEISGLKEELKVLGSDKTKWEEKYKALKEELCSPDLSMSDPSVSLEQQIGMLQQKNAQLIADMRIQSSKFMELERKNGYLVDELETASRMRLRAENALETYQHQVSLAEEAKQDVTDRYNAILIEKNELVAENKELIVLTELRDRVPALEDQNISLQRKVESLRRQLRSMEHAREQDARVLKEVPGMKLSISSLQERVNELEEEVATKDMDLTRQQEDFEDQMLALCEGFEKRGQSIKELETRVSVQASEIAFLRPEATRREKRIEALEKELKETCIERDALNRVASQSDSRGAIITDLKSVVLDRDELAAQLAKEKEALLTARHDIELLTSEKRALKAEVESLKQQHRDSEDTIEELSKAAADEIEAGQEEIARLTNLLEARESALNSTKKKLADLATVYDSLLRQHSELVDERSELVSKATQQTGANGSISHAEVVLEEGRPEFVLQGNQHMAAYSAEPQPDLE
eukprot:CAMPEP_0185031136 /NCGR_PEP_ID=MMETSP1103-20130426/18437_1 /TAXON_ID=36769 /ORGANISM="Paraphysomonas bandaiensis, Strain Caron Lab Isolate" /LENGTH=621 /DNA_ID=CAMNT_0027566547 /DNA_START=44 /DNA_END=1909 /DNA_ORIENTATION=-